MKPNEKDSNGKESIAQTRPEQFVVKGRDPRTSQHEVPDLVFVKDKSVGYLLYRARVDLGSTNRPGMIPVVPSGTAGRGPNGKG